MTILPINCYNDFDNDLMATKNNELKFPFHYKSDKNHSEGGSICNENPFITPSTNALRFYAICLRKDQNFAVIMVHETLFYLSKFNKLQTF